MKIYLSNRPKEYALIDMDDFLLVKNHTWRKDRYGYATTVKRINGKCRTIFMHRLIIAPGVEYDVDHINRNRLDNRKCNLRKATRSQNNLNSKLRNNNTSGTKGVGRHIQSGKWRAYISYGGKQYSLGLYEDKNIAILARREAERNIYGEFAK